MDTIADIDNLFQSKWKKKNCAPDGIEQNNPGKNLYSLYVNVGFVSVSNGETKLEYIC